MPRSWKPSAAPHPRQPPDTISGIARRYHACAVAFASTLGIPLAEALQAYHGPVTAIFIETSRAELRLPATVTLPPLTGGNASATRPPPSPGRPEESDRAHEVVTNGDGRPTTIPLTGGLPCGGLAIETLKPGQLAMLLSKTASLVHAQGDTFVPLLAALQREKARRLEPGHTVPVPSLVPTVDGPDHEPPAQQAEAAAEVVTVPPEETKTSDDQRDSSEAAERQRWGAMSRRSLRVGLSPSTWEALRAGPYGDAERVIVALEQASPNGGA
ncbi:MAG TPA: hypothetical protein VGC99_28840 [Candidatus Tectomicrobia bacterium]